MTRKIPKPKADTNTTIGGKLEKVAHAIADDLLNKTTGEPLIFSDKVTAFKSLTNYYAMMMKMEAPNPDGGEKFGGYLGKDGQVKDGPKQATGSGKRGGNGSHPSFSEPDF